jgi:hypothetical protein
MDECGHPLNYLLYQGYSPGLLVSLRGGVAVHLSRAAELHCRMRRASYWCSASAAARATCLIACRSCILAANAFMLTCWRETLQHRHASTLQPRRRLVALSMRSRDHCGARPSRAGRARQSPTAAARVAHSSSARQCTQRPRCYSERQRTSALVAVASTCMQSSPQCWTGSYTKMEAACMWGGGTTARR